MKARALTTAVFGSYLLAAGPAAANGRYPSAQQLLVDPDDPENLWVRATYGLVNSRGRSEWGWVCEDAIGYGSGEDPMLVMAHGGRLFAGAFAGLFVSADGGCSWSLEPSMAGLQVRDIATDAAHASVAALTSTPLDNGDYELRVFRSSGDPPQFAALGRPIALDLLGFTIDVAPSDPRRLYVSGAMWPLAPSADAGPPPEKPDASPRGPNGPAFLLRSRDGGETWERRRLRGASLYNEPYIAAVHPTNPDVLYVRVKGPDQQQGFISSHLLYSDDAGDSFREIFRGPADMLGFALSPDGGRVYLGLGDSRELSGFRKVEASALGVYEAAAPEFAFSRVFEGQIGCLTYSGSTLFACGAHYSSGFEIAASKDDGRTFETLLDFGGIQGPLRCEGANDVGPECGPAWPATCEPIGVCPSRGADASSEPAPAPQTDSGCCGSESKRSARGGKPAGAALALALAASLALRRRRRSVSPGSRRARRRSGRERRRRRRRGTSARRTPRRTARAAASRTRRGGTPSRCRARW